MAEATVHRATRADAGVVAELQIRLWQQAYSEILPAALLLADPAAMTVRWAARIGSTDPVLIAFEGAHPVGFTAVGTGEADGEIEVLGVLPRWARRGHGGRLLGSAALELRQAGADHGHWWAPEADRSVERFLARVGWLPDGTHRVLDTGEGLLTEIRYSGSLDLVLL